MATFQKKSFNTPDERRTPHLAYIISGQIAVQMNDGTRLDFGPGDLMIAPAGHDGWVLGDEPCVVLDFQNASRAL